MVWVRIDDHFDEHPKFAKAGPLGMALWLAGLAYCNRTLTDGFIPWSVARALIAWEFLDPAASKDGRRKRYRIAMTCGVVGDDVTSEFVIELLLTAGLWVEVDGGYRVHDYDQYQHTRERIEEERRLKQAAGQAGGKARAQARARASAKAGVQAPAQTLAQTPAQTPAQAPAQAPASPDVAPALAPAQAESKPGPCTRLTGLIDAAAAAVNSPVRARARGEADFQPMSTLVEEQRQQRRHTEDLPEEVRERLARPPITVPDAVG
jgi:hypothetical protein